MPKNSSKNSLKKEPKKAPIKRKFKDSDGDGLSDYDEINIFGSDPYNADSNSDGIEDGEAVLSGRDPVTGEKLRDFFIPHAGNNYQPKSLKPKRLFFYGLSVVMVKAILLLLVFSYPITAWMTPDISAEEGRKIIALTNQLRSKLNLGELKGNYKLDQAAVKKVEDMFINQYFAHRSPRGLDLEYFLKSVAYNNYIVVGENLAMGYDSAGEVMTAWENSPTHYENLVDPNFNEIGVALAGGAYLDKETIFIAQYFALPKDLASPVSPKEEIKEIIEEEKTQEIVQTITQEIAQESTEEASISNNKTEEKAVLSATSSPEIILESEVKATKPALESAIALITVNEPSGNKNDKIVRVEANLPIETATASLDIYNTNIEMAPVSATSSEIAEGEVKWMGQAIIYETGNSVTPPIISLSSRDGESKNIEVSNNSIKPEKTSVASQYLLLKDKPSKGLDSIFKISSIYFKFLLVFVIFALLLNIFIQIRKQNLKLILSGSALILFLVLMLIF